MNISTDESALQAARHYSIGFRFHSRADRVEWKGEVYVASEQTSELIPSLASAI
jgi:hypothetical protein